MLNRVRLLAWVLLALVTSILYVGGSAQAAPAVTCANPLNASTCVLSADAPGLAEQGGGNGEGGAYKFNDGGGSSEDSLKNAASDVDSAAIDPKPVNSTLCDWTVLTPPPALGDPRWGGADPASNSIMQNNCDGPVRYAVTPNAAAGAAVPSPTPPPDPAVLARQALSQLVVPQPSIGVGPDRAKLAV